jgi:CIC family chloride channel protein
MLAAGLATFLADRLQPESIYTLPLRRRGIVYADPEDVDIMQTVRVGEIMTTDPDTLAADLPVERAWEEFRRTRHHGFPVVDRGRLIGVCTLTDLSDAAPAEEKARPLTVADACTRHPLTVTPDDPVFRAVRRMATIDVGRLPVVSADDHSRLVGLVRRSDVVKAYRQAVARSLAVQQRKQVRRLRDLSGTQFVELRITANAPTAGQRVRDVSWPSRTILTSIRRDGEAIMPNGDTELCTDDEVTVLTDRDQIEDVRHLLGGGTRHPAVRGH